MFQWWQRQGVKTRLQQVAAASLLVIFIGTFGCWYIWRQMVDIQTEYSRVFNQITAIKDFEERLFQTNLLAMDLLVDKEVSSERKDIYNYLRKYQREERSSLLEAGKDINNLADIEQALTALDKALEGVDLIMRHFQDPNSKPLDYAQIDDLIDGSATSGLAAVQHVMTAQKVRFDKLQAELAQYDKLSLMSIIAQNVLLIFFFLFIGFPVVLRVVHALDEATRKLTQTSTAVSSTCNSLKTASEKVSASATQQASAVEETVATLNQITAMVQRSVENAAHSAEKANVSYLVSREGKETVQQMRVSMQDIQKTVHTMTDEITTIVRRMEGFLRIIDEISSKTQIINDIVFQTKLLSFNASVEAARAGEGGKGFAVVAEEVGSLASTSGQAAREISTLLSKSQSDVQMVIQDTKIQIEKLLAQSSDRIRMGITTADRCDEILQEVVVNVSSVKTMMDDIATAAREEAEGVNNISSAMNQIDTVTHANSDMAHETQNYSSILAEQAQILTHVIGEFDALILGQDASKNIKKSA